MNKQNFNFKSLYELWSLLADFDEETVNYIANYPNECEPKKGFKLPQAVEKSFLSVYPQLRKKLTAVVTDFLGRNRNK